MTLYMGLTTNPLNVRAEHVKSRRYLVVALALELSVWGEEHISEGRLLGHRAGPR